MRQEKQQAAVVKPSTFRCRIARSRRRLFFATATCQTLILRRLRQTTRLPSLRKIPHEISHVLTNIWETLHVVTVKICYVHLDRLLFRDQNELRPAQPSDRFHFPCKCLGVPCREKSDQTQCLFPIQHWKESGGVSPIVPQFFVFYPLRNSLRVSSFLCIFVTNSL